MPIPPDVREAVAREGWTPERIREGHPADVARELQRIRGVGAALAARLIAEAHRDR